MPFMSISAAIAFRKEIGGEDRIMDYCHTLAIEWVDPDLCVAVVM
jgi:hypothetical protein